MKQHPGTLFSRMIMPALLVLILLVIAPWSHAQSRPKSKAFDLIEWNGGKFYYGTYYYPDHWPETMWENDAAMIQAAGLNAIKTGEGAWVTMEPAEGQFNFAWLDRAITVFARHGIKVILGTPSYSPPAWLYAKYPDIAAEDENGVRYRFGSRQNANASNPHYREAVKRIVTAMAEHFRDNPNVLGFSIDNEIGGPYSYDADTLAAFRVWLKNKYHTLDALNHAWGMAFWSLTLTAWDQVPLPWNTGGNPNPSMALDYKRFHSDKISDFLAFQAAILRRLAPGKALTHNGMSPYDVIDYTNLNASLDFAAWDHYPAYDTPDHSDYSPSNWGDDYFRATKHQNFMCMEEMTGMGAGPLYYTQNYDPRLIRTWSYQAVSHGADAINYYRWRQNPYGAEQLSTFILNWDSYPTESYKVVKQMGQELRQITDLLHGSTMVSSVAILVSPDSQWSFRVQPHVKDFDYSQLLLRYYRALRRVQVNVDATFPQSDFSAYKMIVAPTLLVVDKALAGRLEEFVRNGGTLVLTHLSGYKDENNWDTQTTLPGLLKDMSGVAIRDFDPNIAQKQEITLKPDGPSYPVKTWFDILDPTSAETLAVYTNRYYAGKAAITRNKYGAGTVYYVGTEPTSDEFYQKFVDSALRQAGITPGSSLPDGTEVATREKPGKRIVFVINYTDQTKVISLDQEYQNAITHETEPASVPVSAYDVKILTNR